MPQAAKPFDPAAALHHIDQLGFSLGGRYLDLGDSALCCWVHQIHPPQKFRFGYIRRTGLPLVEKHGGRLDDLDIPDNAGLVEVIHVVVFENNIVGADFNFYGPRIGRLGQYLNTMGRGLCDPVAFESLVRPNIAAALQRLGTIRLFRLKVRASFAPNIAMESEPLASAIEALGRLGEADEVDLVLTPKRYSRDGMLWGGLSRIAQGLAGDPDLQDAVSIFKVGGLRTDTGEPTEVDILRDQMVAVEQIVRHSKRGRSLKERSAYEAIIKAYTGLESELSQAASAGIMS